MIESALKDGIWVNKISGSASLSELFEAAFTWFDDPQFEPHIPILWDAREGFLDISYEELTTSYLTQIEQVNTDRPLGRTAWLVSNTVIAYVLREIITKVKWAAEWRTFNATDPSEAIEWLQELERSDTQL